MQARDHGQQCTIIINFTKNVLFLKKILSQQVNQECSTLLFTHFYKKKTQKALELFITPPPSLIPHGESTAGPLPVTKQACHWKHQKEHWLLHNTEKQTLPTDITVCTDETISEEDLLTLAPTVYPDYTHVCAPVWQSILDA